MPASSRNGIGGVVLVLLLLLAVPAREAIRDTWPWETAAERSRRMHEAEGAAELQKAIWASKSDPHEVALRRLNASLKQILKKHPGTRAAEVAIEILCPATGHVSPELSRMIRSARTIVDERTLPTADDFASWNAEWERHWKVFAAEAPSRTGEIR